ncbi:hypothetical protein AVEN_241610-1 [Araneus ventricosus]|uniref:Mariner Mos1 transposase n=1 Tax=Araneus ventricosus TaxID=182803 RepID=A0A4Y2VFR7_ARAVE|nr:hypothetical protein AVEN_241610-1 [Araneus ventricosus]
MRYQAEGVSFPHRIFTGDETRVHHVTPETKKESRSWRCPSSPPHKKIKTVPSAKKVMATVFWDHQGLLMVHFHTRVVTVNADSYCATLDLLQKAFHRKRRELLSKGVPLLHDNARPHTASATHDLKQRFRLNVFNTLLTALISHQVILISSDLCRCT